MNSNLPPAVSGFLPLAITSYIQSITQEHDIVLDPFSVRGIVAVELLRQGRRAVAIERNPLTAFFAETLLRPASLPRLTWAFEDVRAICRDEMAGMYSTRCPKCGRQATITAVERGDGKLLRIDFICACTGKRLTKKPDAADHSADEHLSQLETPYWHPELHLPAAGGILRYPFDFSHRRIVSALSLMLHAIENLPEGSARDVLQAAFASSLKTDPPRNPQPPSGSRGRSGRAVQREENPWVAFESAFQAWYGAKRETNRILKDVVIGRTMDDLSSGRADALILIAASPEPAAGELGEGSLDAVLGLAPENSSKDGPYRSPI